jgi:hypothetical protein
MDTIYESVACSGFLVTRPGWYSSRTLLAGQGIVPFLPCALVEPACAGLLPG